MEKKKGSIWRKLLLIFVLLVTAALVILPFVLDRMSEKTGDGASLVSAAVTRADISRTVSGAGTVGAKDAVVVSIPSDVVLTGYAVTDGAVVCAGDPIAFVDRVSVYIVVLQCDNAENEKDAFACLAGHTKRCVVKSKTAQKDLIELNCEIRLLDDSTDFINELAAMPGVRSAVLVSYNGDYMG